ncbi:hypothetical protein HanIR_Chr14g0704491 [Helianthus annuus]|nr:hypothetical protein HanIR_Chr14g0704491 [Helianthus annuus]
MNALSIRLFKSLGRTALPLFGLFQGLRSTRPGFLGLFQRFNSQGLCLLRLNRNCLSCSFLFAQGNVRCLGVRQLLPSTKQIVILLSPRFIPLLALVGQLFVPTLAFIRKEFSKSTNLFQLSSGSPLRGLLLLLKRSSILLKLLRTRTSSLDQLFRFGTHASNFILSA